MKEFLLDNWGALIIPLIIIVAFVVGGIQRYRERKLYGIKPKESDPLGTVGKAMGAYVFRGLPTDITGMPPSGHFQKLDFSYDEEEEEHYGKQ